ncbi:TetR/AcrR family transcriptional regulator [Asanoa iriomotensis]|uniref:TetR family transcriptional regulator n=1 Tax=Asanoa iriomotensis TaxID=234613 RepID=A0ABQ4C414_9ACTN|nr:TetR/AcrR family transcriptional regulator [Asanoa iriomotensis]GIF57515.1 TetR family transcriptional regulator [Asanoa iriomotensis]
MRADAARNRARILAAAEAVFAERGAAGSTEEVASRAGVAVGTVFRHFPTKDDLLRAVMKDLLDRLHAQVDALTAADPGAALFRFFEHLVAQAAAKRAVVELLGLAVDEPLRGFTDAVAGLLAAGQRAGTVRAEVGTAETMALLTSITQGALHGGWSPDLQRRTLAIVFAGLRPTG